MPKAERRAKLKRLKRFYLELSIETGYHQWRMRAAVRCLPATYSSLWN